MPRTALIIAACAAFALLADQAAAESAATPQPPEAAEAERPKAAKSESAAETPAETAPAALTQAATIKIPSLKPPHEIEATGFDKAADVAQILSRLGRESDPARFVAADVEAEIYRQTPGAQLLAIDCVETPATEMSLFLEGDPEAEDLERGLVDGLQTSFPLILTLRDEAGQTWRLRTTLAYEAVDLRDPKARKVTANFTILGHQKL